MGAPENPFADPPEMPPAATMDDIELGVAPAYTPLAKSEETPAGEVKETILGSLTQPQCFLIALMYGIVMIVLPSAILTAISFQPRPDAYNFFCTPEYSFGRNAIPAWMLIGWLVLPWFIMFARRIPIPASETDILTIGLGLIASCVFTGCTIFYVHYKAVRWHICAPKDEGMVNYKWELDSFKGLPGLG